MSRRVSEFRPRTLSFDLVVLVLLFTVFNKSETQDDRHGDEVMELMPTHASVHPRLSIRRRTAAVRAEPSVVGAWRLL
jgi:hypothetical protein